MVCLPCDRANGLPDGLPDGTAAAMQRAWPSNDSVNRRFTCAVMASLAVSGKALEFNFSRMPCAQAMSTIFILLSCLPTDTAVASAATVIVSEGVDAPCPVMNFESVSMLAQVAASIIPLMPLSRVCRKHLDTQTVATTMPLVTT